MPNSQLLAGTENQDALRAEYGEVCSNFRTLTEIRFKLLAFLPLAAGVTTAVSGNSLAGQFLISLFGLFVTIGLATYNSRNDQLYDELVGRAAEIERRLGLPGGAFANRPGPWLTLSIGILHHRIDHRTGVGLIYAASFALWLYGVTAPALEFLRRQSWAGQEPLPATLVPPAALLLTLAVILAAFHKIGAQRKKRESAMARAAARAAGVAKVRPLGELAGDNAFVDDCNLLSGAGDEKIRARIRFFASLDPDGLRFYVAAGSELEEASYLVGLITDLPPRWIHDCATNRKGVLPS